MGLLRRTISLLCIALAPHAQAQQPSALPDPITALSGAPLARALQRGGYTIYFRHAATDFSQTDRNVTAFEDCSLQRNLNDAGRRDAQAVGDAIRAMKITVSEVISSPYCRTMETARLMFGRASASRDAIGSMTPTGKPDYSALEKILATPPEAVTLRAVVSHGNPFQAIAGEPVLAEGEAAVIRGDGVRWIIVARIPIAAWPSLVAAGN